MKKIPNVIIQAEIAKRLQANPRLSNRLIAAEFNVSESMVRRTRAFMELSNMLPQVESRIGADGIEQRHAFV